MENVVEKYIFQVPKLYKNGELDTNVWEFGFGKAPRKGFYFGTTDAGYYDEFQVKIHSTEAKYNGPFGDVSVDISEGPSLAFPCRGC